MLAFFGISTPVFCKEMLKLLAQSTRTNKVVDTMQTGHRFFICSETRHFPDSASPRIFSATDLTVGTLHG